MSEVLTIEEAAARLKFKPDTVRDWLKAGRVKGQKFGRVWRVDAEDLERVLREGPAPGRAEADQYEKFIAELIEDVRGAGRDIRERQCGRKNLYTGASGQKHQIDVSFLDASFETPTFVLIECKRLTAPIKLEHVKVVHATLKDITAAAENPAVGLAIIVSTQGAQVGARRYAAYYGIRLEIVNHGPPYGFRYENVVLHGLPLGTAVGISVAATQNRRCRLCTREFVDEENEELCPVCLAASA